MTGALLVYAASENATQDAETAALARAAGALVNIVDNLADSAFITPAIVDRDPVVVAIGTEGAAPVLARLIKADIEETLPGNLGPRARRGKAFRKAAEALPMGRKRREFWADYYTKNGSLDVDLKDFSLQDLLNTHQQASPSAGHLDISRAGSDDAGLLNLNARKALQRADLVISDPEITAQILDLARREARFVTAVTPHQTQSEIRRALQNGQQVVRLKSGRSIGNIDINSEMLDIENAAESKEYPTIPIPANSPFRPAAQREKI